MVRYKFKIGDKVKLKPQYIKVFRMQGTKVGVIIEFRGKYIRVKFDGRSWGFPYKPNEIELITKAGEQLVFNFMLEG